MIKIIRLAPVDSALHVDFTADGLPESCRFFAEYRETDCTQLSGRISCARGSADLTRIPNNVDFALRIAADLPSGETVEVSPERLFRCGYVPGKVVAYLHPSDKTFASSGYSTCSPSIVRLPDGALLASHDIFTSGGGQNISHIYRSDDNGETWRFASELFPCFWGLLFTHRGGLYMLACSTEYGALILYRSPDGGFTWEGPVELLAGGSREHGGPHKAPMQMVEYNGRIWSAVEFGSWGTGTHRPGAVSAAVDSDLMDPTSWVCTGFTDYDSNWPGTVTGNQRGGAIEGNIVVSPEGRLFDVLRYPTGGCVPNYGKALVMELDPFHPGKPMRFYSVIDFPGNNSKFYIMRDEHSGLYYSLSNRVFTERLAQRNILTLSVSADLKNWRVLRDILNFADNYHCEDASKVGFQYPSFIFDGNDILALVRTAFNNAHNFHDANYITLHRIVNYARS